jgi:hypothetical protein
MNSKYFGVALGILVLACVAIAVIVSRPSGSSNKKSSSSKVINLLDYENQDATLAVTIEGPIVGDDQRQALRMTVSPEDRGIELLDGYDQNIVRSKHYTNNQGGYEYFIRAINNVGFTLKRPSTITDERGICPDGEIYIYDLYDGSGQLVNHTWGTSCGLTIGTFAGYGPNVRDLFTKQITDYDDFTSGISI